VAAWLIEAGFMGFGGQKTESKPNDFLPFKLPENDSPVAKLKASLSQETIEIFRELVTTGEIPGHIVRDFWLVEGLQELILEEVESRR
jgi:hypothetical protein